MQIPVFNLDGVLPPFIGQKAGVTGDLQSPYKTTLDDVITRLGFSEKRLRLLLKFITYRRRLRQLGISSGRHWVDGSFVENKEPDDLDVVTLLGADEISEDKELAAYALGPFTNRDAVKKIFEMDGIIVDMDGDRGVMLDRIGFLLTLFSHRREDFIWKGILSIPIASADNDDSAEGRIQQLLGIGGGT